jgi:HD-GYP domain-containing protein (c-di-GMP phosphodiesterase class II)
MPVLVPCDELKPQMCLTEPIRQSGRMLLSANKTLTAGDITALKNRFPDICVRVADPVLDEVVEFEDDSRDIQTFEAVSTKIAESIAEVGKHYARNPTLNHLHVGRIQQVVAEGLRSLEENAITPAVVMRGTADDNYHARHAGNAFCLAMLLGSAVREYVVRERMRQIKAADVNQQLLLDLTALGLGVACMDLGMLPLRELYGEDRPLTAEEQESVQRHPDAGAEMLPDSVSLLAQTIVRTHHESFDGSGYPRRLSGDRLHVFSRIARIADAFDAATSKHVYKEAKTPARAIWEMKDGPYRKCYDPVLMRVFARLIQPYPIGAKLRLTDGRQAVVVGYNRKDPFFPHVVIAFDQAGNHLPVDVLKNPFQLGKHSELRISGFGNEDLSYIYSGGATERGAVRDRQFTTLFEAAYP